MRRKGISKSVKMLAIVLSAAVVMSTTAPAAVYAQEASQLSEDWYEEETSQLSEDWYEEDTGLLSEDLEEEEGEDVTIPELNYEYYSGMEKLAEDPYTFDYSTGPEEDEYRVGDFICRGTIMISYIGTNKNLVIPEGITIIGDPDVGLSSALGGMAITSVKLSSTVKSVGSRTFRGCSYLSSVTLNQGLESLGVFAFEDCIGLKKIVIPASVKLIDSSCFEGAANLAQVTIKGKEIQINDDAFEGTKFLKGLYNKENVAIYQNILLDAKNYKKTKYTIPASVTSIGGGAFFDNKYVKQIVMHDKVTIIGDEAFRSMNCLEKINLSKSLKIIGDWSFVGIDDLEEITIPKSVEYIGELAFFGCDYLKTIDIKTKTMNIGESAFQSTEWLEDRKEESPLVVVNGVLIEGSSAFGDIVIPNTVKRIGDMVFWCNEEITGVSIPDTVTEIGFGAFNECINLKTVEFGNSIQKIDKYAFSGCTALKKAILPDCITIIEKGAFKECTSLSQLRLGNQLTTIGDWAFEGIGIKTLVIPQKLTRFNSRAFEGGVEDVEKVYLSDTGKTTGIKYYYMFGSSYDFDVRYPTGTAYSWLSEYQDELRIQADTPVYQMNHSSVTLYESGYGKRLQVEDQFQRTVSNTKVTWKSSNEKVATVTNGKVMPVGTGTAKVTATYNNKTYTSTITVKAPYQTRAKITLEKYDVTYLYVWGAKTSMIKWSTSDKSIVAVSSKGKIRGVKKGTATITATINGKRYTSKVTVK